MKSQNRNSFLLVFAAYLCFTALLFLVLLIAYAPSAAASKSGGFPLPVAILIAAVAALAATLFAALRLRPQLEEGCTPQKFHSDCMTALALSELSALIGFMRGTAGGSGPWGYLEFAIITLAVDLFVILPIGLAYWSPRS